MREPDALDDAVARADLFRSRQAAFGRARHPEALRFAASVPTAMSADCGCRGQAYFAFCQWKPLWS